MVLLASDMVGPYTDHVATLLGYPVGFVQVIAARLIEAGIWDNDEVSSEPWLDPLKGVCRSCWISWSQKVSSLAAGRKKGATQLLVSRILGRFTIRSVIDTGGCQVCTRRKAFRLPAQTREVAAAEDAGVKFTASFSGRAADSLFAKACCRSINPLVLFVVFLA
jgi:hypothetical protein